MTDALLFTVFLIGMVLTGDGIVALCGLHRARTLVGRASAAFAIGACALTITLLTFTLVGIPLARWCALVVLVPGAIQLVSLWRTGTGGSERDSPTEGRAGPFGWALRIATALGIAAAIGVGFSGTFSQTDALLTWQAKARGFFAHGEIDAFLNTGHAKHHDYPLHVPLLGTATYEVLERVDETYGKFLHWLYYLALLGLVRDTLFGRVPGTVRRVAVAVTAMLPAAIDSVGSGMADLPCCVYLTGAFAAVGRYASRSTGASARAIVLWALAAAWTKNEGAVALAFGCLGLAFIAVRRRRLADLSALAFLAAGIPWVWFRLGLGWSSHLDETLPWGIAEGLRRIPEITNGVGRAMLQPSWLFLWPAAVVLIVSRGYRWGSDTRAVAVMWSATLASYLSVLVVTGNDHLWLIDTALDRLLLQLAPGLILLVALGFVSAAPVARTPPRESRHGAEGR